MARALWISEEAPDRNQGGGNIRQAHLLGALAGQMETDLLVAAPVEDPEIRSRCRRVVEVSARAARPRDNRQLRRLHDLWLALIEPAPREACDIAAARAAMAKRLPALLAETPYDVIVVNQYGLMDLLPAVRAGRWVAHFHHAAGQKAHQTQTTAPGRRQRWIYSREAGKCLRLEHWILEAYDGVVVCSAEDAESLGYGDGRSHGRAGRLIVTPNGVDTNRYLPSPIPAEPRLILPATLDYLPNVDGALWFADQVLPLVQSAVPGLALDVVGRHPVPQVLALATRPGIRVVADVASMAPFLAAARVVVVPLRIGTGTRLKALEAMAAGRPVVGTTIGLGGLGLVDGVQARLVDDPGAMATAIVELLRSDAGAAALASAGRTLVEQRYQWPAIGAEFAASMTALVSAPPEPTRGVAVPP